MTGPEHFRRAEEHLQYARETDSADESAWQQRQAQAHATLAHAAATALNLPHPDPASGLPRADWEAWTEAASEEGKREAS